MGLIDRLKSEPAVVIGAIAGTILAAVQYASGHDLIGTGVADIIAGALDPTGGWLIPILIGVVTRFFVSPAGKSA